MEAVGVRLGADGVVEPRGGADVDRLARVEAEEPQQPAERGVGPGHRTHLVLRA